MRLRYRKTFGVAEVVDGVFYQLYKLPAAALRVLRFSRYETARLIVLVGGGGLGYYIYNAVKLVTYNGPEKLDTPAKFIVSTSAALATALFLTLFYKNLRAIRRAKARELRLEQLNQEEAFAHTTEKYRDQNVRAALWYFATPLLWLGFEYLYVTYGGVSLESPYVTRMTLSGIVSTTGVFGPRYILTTPYGIPSLERILKRGGKK